jgi:hypothetical protein
MYALSVEPHWAWAIIHGVKRIENRKWRTRHRGPLVIHASKTTRNIESERHLIPGLPPTDQLVRGAFIGVVSVDDCQPVSEVSTQPYAVGPQCWLLSKPQAIRPFPYRGTTMLFQVPKSLAQRIQSQQ